MANMEKYEKVYHTVDGEKIDVTKKVFRLSAQQAWHLLVLITEAADNAETKKKFQSSFPAARAQVELLRIINEQV